MNDLATLIVQGESETLEFKKSTGQLSRAIETLTAFANKEPMPPVNRSRRDDLMDDAKVLSVNQSRRDDLMVEDKSDISIKSRRDDRIKTDNYG